MQLFLYNLDAPKDAEPLCKLKVGEYNVGRGQMLKCNDNRISRNHVLIAVKDDEVSITSTHQNPCFYQGATSKTITILPLNDPTIITDGDKFGFLPDQYWYRTQIDSSAKNDCKDESSQSTNLSATDYQNEDVRDTNKRLHEDTNESPKKYLKLDCDVSEQKVECSEQKLDSTQMDEDDSNLLLDKSNNSNHSLDLFAIDDNYKDYDDSGDKSNIEPKAEDLEDKKPNLSEDQFYSNSENKDNVGEANLNLINILSDLKEANDDTNDSLDLLATVDLSSIEAKNENVKEEIDFTQNESIGLCSDDKVDVDGSSNVLTGLKNSNNNVIASPVDNNAAVRDASANDEAGSSNMANASDDNVTSSTTDPAKVYRERCSYGAKCYRKNSAHKREFSHPTDSDYDTDPEDKRPICIYGSACYRKSKLHRAHFRHPKSSSRVTRKRNNRRNDSPSQGNESSLDDYDLDDPFIDDSEDDYSVGNDSESDSEYVESQDVEEDTKGLLKEARRFVKK